MDIATLILNHAIADERFERFNNLDPSRMDYTLRVEQPNGQVRILRNPDEAADGSLSDKCYSVPDGTKLLAAGTAFWEWTVKQQHTVGIDIDTDDTHANGLACGAFEAALDAVVRVPWLEARRSSGGKGLHVFPKFKEPIDAATRAEGSALARAVLTLASREADFDFKAAKDCAGGNMWVYKSDAPANAYEIVKEATVALDPERLPAGWREATAASGRSNRFAPSTVKLSAEHLAIEKQLVSLGYSLIYVHNLGCYHIHTFALQEAHNKFGYRGHFATASEGTDPCEPNGFMFPLPGGAFLVKRFGNAVEDASWFAGPNGQYTFLNVEVPFDTALNHFSINKTTKGFAFDCGRLEAMLKASGVNLEIPVALEGRTLFVKTVKGVAHVSVERHDIDASIKDWTATGKTWQRSFPLPATPEAFAHADVVLVSDKIRAVTTDTESAKWCIKTDGLWIGTTASEIGNVLVSHEIKSPPATMGLMRQQPYWLVFEPFRDEYLPNRRWNREAPQLACQPVAEALDTPTWNAVFDHLGSGFDDDVTADEVCRNQGITSGSHYLKLWVKLLLEKPQQRTPYLFLTSRQNNTGKTSLGASISHLINPGVAEINDEALVDKFTGEFEGKVLCLIEELDLRDKRNKAYATLKRVLTSKTLTIRRMRTDAYNVPNFTHFIHTANDANFVPCETEDMRIVMINVPQITNLIDSLVFEEGIKRESPSMLRQLLDMPLPSACGRFWLPVVQTSLKESVVTGLYESEVSEAEEGLRKFASTCLKKDPTELEPQTAVLARYAAYCVAEGIPPLPKIGFLKALRDKANINVDKKQKRVDGGKRQWHYTGISLKA